MGDSMVTILTEARAAGLDIRIEPGRLVVRGPRMLEDIAQRLLARKHEVLALLGEEDADVAWRVAAMRPQVPIRGPIPLLVARNTRPVVGHCITCGDRFSLAGTFRCSPCTRAAWLVLHEIREGVDAYPVE